VSETATQLLATFDLLPPLEKHELLAEMLRRSGELEESFLTDESLVGLADELFETLDAEESNACESDPK